jgi:hypothetical protein
MFNSVEELKIWIKEYIDKKGKSSLHFEFWIISDKGSIINIL